VQDVGPGAEALPFSRSRYEEERRVVCGESYVETGTRTNVASAIIERLDPEKEGEDHGDEDVRRVRDKAGRHRSQAYGSG
jgi:hypothetical protein